jgi:hypothetical protein
VQYAAGKIEDKEGGGIFRVSARVTNRSLHADILFPIPG